jgi:integrase
VYVSRLHPTRLTPDNRIPDISNNVGPIVSIAVLTGLRIGEILGLRWKRIDLLHSMMEVAETYSSGEFGPPKTRSSRRTIPISSSLVEIFKRLRPLSCEPETLVFTTAKGTPLNSKNLYNRELAPASDAIGLPRVSWHSFRHTHATLLHESGESLKTAQALLGHSDLETTLGGVHPRNSGLAKEGCRASRGSFGPGWTR